MIDGRAYLRVNQYDQHVKNDFDAIDIWDLSIKNYIKKYGEKENSGVLFKFLLKRRSLIEHVTAVKPIRSCNHVNLQGRRCSSLRRLA